MATAQYIVYVDWDGDGELEQLLFLSPWQVATTGDAIYEDVTSQVRADPGILTVRGRDQIRALAPPMAGRADMELDNQDKRFSPEYASGPLYGNLLPGRIVQVQAISGGTVYYLFTGVLDDLPQHPEPRKRTVSIPSLGNLSQLVGQKVSTALYSNITTDVALGHLLDAAGWPAGDRVLDTGKTTLAWWWLAEEDAWAAALALLNTEGPGAALYEDGQGRIVFESRHYRLLTARSTASQATFRDTGAEPLFSEPFRYNPGLKDIINQCTVEVKTRVAQATAAVWSYDGTVALAPNEVRQFVVTSSNPFQSAINPVGATDYTLSAGSLASATLDRASGASATLTLTAGASGATLTGLQVRADAVTVTSTTLVTNSIDTTVSQGRYGLRPYNLAIRAEVAANTAQDFCNAIVSLYQEPRPTAEFAVNNAHADRLTQILNREISDRITIVEAQTAVNHDYFVERIGHRVGSAGGHHVATIGAEKAGTTTYAVWGTSLWGTGVWGY